MKRDFFGGILFRLILVLGLFAGLIVPSGVNAKGEPIIIGCPVDMGIYYGPDCRDAQLLAIKEINAAGGVNVGGEMRPFKLVIQDTRAMQPGVPVTEALLAIERLLAEKKADFLIGGPVRSEAAFAARGMVNNYKKVWILTTGSYSPKFGDGKKYPYAFRIQGDVGWEITNVHVGLLKYLRDTFGFNRIYITYIPHLGGGIF